LIDLTPDPLDAKRRGSLAKGPPSLLFRNVLTPGASPRPV